VCCTLLRSQWYQEQVDGTPPISMQSRLGHARYGVVMPEPFRPHDDGVDGFVASFLAAPVSSSARSLTTGVSCRRLPVPLFNADSSLSGRNLRSGQATPLSYLGATKGSGADCGRHGIF